MNRVKAIFRSWGIPCGGKSVCNPRHRDEWLSKIRGSRRVPPGGALLRAARCAGFLAPASATKAPGREPEALCLEIAPLDSGPGSDSRGPADGHCPDAPPVPQQAAALEIQRVGGGDAHQCRSPVCRGAAGTIQESRYRFAGSSPITITISRICSRVRRIQAATREGPFREFYEALVAKGMRPKMARLTLARKMAAITLTVWRKGVAFDAKYLKPQTA